MVLLLEEPVSPELVLVDSDLASQLRARLPEPADALANVDTRHIDSSAPMVSAVHRSHTTASADSMAALRRLADGEFEWDEYSPNGRRVARVVLLCTVATVAAAVLLTALLVRGPATSQVLGVFSDQKSHSGAPSVSRHRVRAQTSAKPTDARAASSPAASPSHASGETRGPGGQRLAPPVGRHIVSLSTATAHTLIWPRTPRASGYHVQIVRKGSQIFVADTSRSRLRIPATWRFHGGVRYLEPQDRLYIWPVVRGQRLSTPTVHTQIDLDAR